jgi:hypothetical protein
MGYVNEYIARRLSANDFEGELTKLISTYNSLRKTYAIVYVAAVGKNIPDAALSQDDYYIIHDLLRGVTSPKVDIYLETNGGRGEAAEEIVRFLRGNFSEVAFVVSGEAKSAGTIMVLSGDEILMTETGSLGPIDAQVKIGRSVVSAYDYIEWTDGKREEADKNGKLNPFDVVMVAQISPGELSSVTHALKYAEDLVVEWLSKYKFKNWNVTETRRLSVTEEMKRQRAEEIARELCNHGKWRLHGRSIKAADLDSIGLKITKTEATPKLNEVVCRIQTVCRLLFDSTQTYKIFATQDNKVFKRATQASAVRNAPGMVVPGIAEVDVKCTKCGKDYRLYAKFTPDPRVDEQLKKKGRIAYPKEDRIRCDCGFEIDLAGLRNTLESQVGKKVIV